MHKILLVGLLLFTQLLQAQQKRAVIVAVGDYPATSGIRSVHAANDIPLIKSALQKLGFKPQDIQVLKDAQATKAGIIKAITTQLIDKSKPGDVAYFHFSGHGQQIQDKDGDEVDGFDEALLPYDALMEFIPGLYEGQNHLADDELGLLYNRLQKKLGANGHFLLTIDACHSGTSTRGIGASRGTDIPLAPAGYRPKFDKPPKESNDEKLSGDPKKLASLVGFFGSMAHQLNYELDAEDGKTYGALSYAFSKAVNQLTANASYQQLFDRIRLIIGAQPNNQTPEATGILAQKVLGGKYLETPSYYTVKEFVGPQEVLIDGGFLNSITEGTVVGFYPPETRDPGSAVLLTTGTVKSVQSNTAQIVLKDPLPKESLESSWVVVKEEYFGDLQIKLKVDPLLMKRDRPFFSKLFELPFLKNVELGPDLLLYPESDKLLLINKADVLIDEFPNNLSPIELSKRLKWSLTKFGQAQYIRKLNQENVRLGLRFDFVLYARKGMVVPSNFTTDSLKNAAGIVEFMLGDTIGIKVTNGGNQAAYFTLLDFQPNEKINVLVPDVHESPADYFLEPGGTKLLRQRFRIDPPMGQELFRLIATRNPINLRPLDQRRGIPDVPVTPQDPFENLFKQTDLQSGNGLRGGKVASLPAGQVNIYSKQFVIKQQ